MKKHALLLITLLIVTMQVMQITGQTAFAEPENTGAVHQAPASETPQVPQKEFPQIHAGASILTDLKTGRILYENNSREKMYPASTTKILTGIMAIENLELDRVVTATDAAIAPITREHSSMGILRGEQLTVEQLLYGLLVHSANDAANVLAVEMGGSIEGFATMMNERAEELGAHDSHFVNPHGFHDDDHYTTAYDLAVIARYAMNNEKFREFVKTTRYIIPPTNKYKTDRILITTNNLISKFKTAANFYEYATGIKTGSTDKAQNCLVASAKKGDTEFISVLMKCPNQGSGATAYSFSDTKALFEYAFDTYEYVTIASANDIVSDSKVYEAKDDARVALSPKDEISMLLPKNLDKAKDIVINAETEENIKAPIQKGQVLGKVSYSYNGELLGSTDLIASNTVERDNILFVIHSVVNTVKSPFFYIPAAILAVAAIILRIRIVNNRKRRRSYARRSRYNNRNRY
ncbi:MAG: D-alanyl-D-alanine carboxypeptidase [Oscillospiraceae bacterium]|nr:D-alanyl-D-alanine carboxypeptidase [Oscillospiraceae bacterium]